MEYSTFLKLLLTYKQVSEDLSQLHDIGIDFFEGKYRLSDLTYSLFFTSFESSYTTEGIEWIEWFIFEADWGTKDFSTDTETRWGAYDENKNPIAYSYESLWELLEKNYKKT